MAESKRGSKSGPVLDDEAQQKKERILLWAILGIFVVIVAGMFILSGFLSGN